MCRKITSHWQPLFSKKIAAAAALFSYKIGGGTGGGLIFLQNWRLRQGFGNITGGCSEMVWILEGPRVSLNAELGKLCPFSAPRGHTFSTSRLSCTLAAVMASHSLRLNFSVVYYFSLHLPYKELNHITEAVYKINIFHRSK